LKELSTKRLAVDQKNYAEVLLFDRGHLSICITTSALVPCHLMFCFLVIGSFS
jgi:hypothetical protein